MRRVYIFFSLLLIVAFIFTNSINLRLPVDSTDSSDSTTGEKYETDDPDIDIEDDILPDTTNSIIQV